ncbi:uncharacterized protein K441DRAFT_330198 [Cenococcum geophilum 1.58]|uniref:Uncharacterized protein n=1 Tax=Cenococcum geophilum 1.58 TaxID=794803 RepID=A0ACC8EP50_9PEZI|nr:hypothetical protein K441DRAFT_330198 [Cenococcum geophilum 1.58]
MLRDPPCALCVKQDYECRVYKQNSGPHFGGACSRCRLSGRSCEKDSLLRSEPVTPQRKKRTQLASASNPAGTPTKKLRTRTIPPPETSPPPKTPTRSDMRSCRGIRSVAAPPTLSLIPGTPGAASGTAATPAGMENVRGYSAIAVSARVNIVRERVAEVAKDVRAIDHRLSKLEGSLSEIKDELAFIRRGITALIRNAGLPDIELE